MKKIRPSNIYRYLPAGYAVPYPYFFAAPCLRKKAEVLENLFGLLKSEPLYLQTHEYPEQFKAELIDYTDYYNNRRIKAKPKGLRPAIHRQQALSAVKLKYLSNFLGSLQMSNPFYMLIPF